MLAETQPSPQGNPLENPLFHDHGARTARRKETCACV